MGIQKEKIIVRGIPTDQKFAMPKDRIQLRKKLNLNENMFTVLVATGSFGIGPIEKVVNAVDGFQVLVVCGHNTKLLERLKGNPKADLHAYGLVDNMEELMGAANVMVTKPGGLSIAEALVSHLPLIFFSAIPGQETNNIRVLKEYGIGTQECGIREIAEELKRLKNSPVYYQEMVKKVKTIACPDAVGEIVKLIKM